MDRVIHTRWSHQHRHSVLLTALDASLVAIVTLLAMWVIVVLALLIDGMAAAGA